MIKIRLCFPQNNQISFFETDIHNRFTYTGSGNNTKILLDNVSGIFDGICDNNGFYHFVIQDLNGSLIYLKSDKNNWIKYQIFESKRKVCSVVKINLCAAKNMLCAFYVMEHDGKYLLVKHLFSDTSLRLMPDVIGSVDSRRDFCVCRTDEKIIVFFRNEYGIREEKSFDYDFNNLKHKCRIYGSSIFRLNAIKTESDIYVGYIKEKNNIASLYFCKYSKPDECKIITFGISKNSDIFISSHGSNINIIWQENGILMESESKDSGAEFSIPKVLAEKYNIFKLNPNSLQRFQLHGNCLLANKFSELKNKYMEGQKKMENFSDSFETPENFYHSLTQIQSQVEKIGIHMEQICSFLDRLTKFKKEIRSDADIALYKDELTIAKNEHLSGQDIGERNEDNITAFENMTIDE